MTVIRAVMFGFLDSGNTFNRVISKKVTVTGAGVVTKEGKNGRDIMGVTKSPIENILILNFYRNN
jgi:hypothetical protein